MFFIDPNPKLPNLKYLPPQRRVNAVSTPRQHRVNLNDYFLINCYALLALPNFILIKPPPPLKCILTLFPFRMSKQADKPGKLVRVTKKGDIAEISVEKTTIRGDAYKTVKLMVQTGYSFE